MFVKDLPVLSHGCQLHPCQKYGSLLLPLGPVFYHQQGPLNPSIVGILQFYDHQSVGSLYVGERILSER